MRSSVGLPLVIGAAIIGSSFVGATVAWAEPGDGPLIETTCTYAQIEAAMKVEAPELAAELAQQPQAQRQLQALLALPVDQRRQRLDQALNRNPQRLTTFADQRDTPEGQAKVQMLTQIANTCGNY